MNELSMSEVEQVSGGALDFAEGAALVLAVGAMGGPATFAFALPIAGAMFYLH